MATLNATRTAAPGLVERILTAVSAARAEFRRYSVYRQTLRELNALTDREMADLGIHAAMIPQIAREAAWGK